MKRGRTFWALFTGLALVVGIGVRIYAAWTLKHVPMRDASIPMLMARHMSEGEPMPVFYYGQAYMGSMEALVSSWVMRIMGPTPFAACLGTVLLSVVALILTVQFAKSIAGPQAACFTAVLMIATSDASLYLSAHPRGGYMVMQVCGLGVLFCMSRVLRRLDDGQLPTWSWELPLAGFLAGVGWWNLQLVVIYLLAAVLIGIPRLGRLIRRPDVYLAVGTFALGSMPWWWWNLTHGAESMSMNRSIGTVELGVGMNRFVPQALDMMGWKDPSAWMPLRVAAGMFLLCNALWMLSREGFRAPTPSHRSCRGLGAHLWVLAATFAIYSVSHFSSFNTSRYLLPLYPSFAVLAGVVLSRMTRLRWARFVVPVLLALAVAQNNFKLHLWNDAVPQHDEEWAKGQALSEALNTYADGIALGGMLQHWLTVASEEQALVVEAPVDVYAPYNRKWARVEKQAVLDHNRQFAAFLRESGGRADRERLGGLHLYHSLKGPDLQVTPLSADRLAQVTSSGGEGRVLMDLDAGTYLEADAEGALDVDVSFQEPVSLAGLALPCLTEQDTGTIRVWGLTETGESRLLKETGPGTMFFWSGDRLVHMGLGYHRQVRWDPVRLRGLRLELLSFTQPLRELMLLTPREEEVRVSLADGHTLSINATDVVAVRSVVDQMELAEGTPRMIRSSFWYRGLNDLPTRDPDSFYYLPAWSSLTVQVPPSFARISRHALQQAGLTWKEAMAEEAILFHLPELNPDAYPGGLLPVAFTECGLFYDSDFRLDRWNRAHRLLMEAEDMSDGDRKTRWLQEAARLCPDSPRVREVTGNTEAVTPMAVFRNGVTLRKVTWETPSFSLRLIWTWEIPAEVDLRERSLFVHVVQDGRILFQDDHNPGHLVAEDLASPQPLNRVATLERTLTLPAGVSGPVELHIGWIDPPTGKRLRIRSGDRVEKGKLRIGGITLPEGGAGDE